MQQQSFVSPSPQFDPNNKKYHFCYFHVETWALIATISHIIYSIILLCFLVIFGIVVASFKSDPQTGAVFDDVLENMKSVDKDLELHMILESVVFVSLIGLGSLAVHGIRKNKKNLLIPFLVLQVHFLKLL